jgi:hypothetical protein
MNSLIQLKKTTPLFLIALVLGCFALLPRAQAVGPDTEGTILGSNNGEGIGVLVSRTTGVWNTGTGREALNHLTSGNQNTATGLRALFSDTNGGFNTATGVYSLFTNTGGFYNTATGAYSLTHNTIGTQNTANGYQALFSNTTGFGNTATGFRALFSNTGASNTATGANALYSNTTGDRNTAIGSSALGDNTTGGGNTAIGGFALANTTGGNNTALGWGAGINVTTANNVIAIGHAGANVSNSSFIGNVFNQLSSQGTGVFINSAGKLGTTPSSRRVKENITPMGKASEVILALKPVTFHYKKDIDPQSAPQFGLVAEEVEKVNPDLIVRDNEGKPYSVRYDQVNAMLLNEFLKEHRKNEEQQATIARLIATDTHQQKQIEALTAALHKVSAQLELSESAPHTVLNDH